MGHDWRCSIHTVTVVIRVGELVFLFAKFGTARIGQFKLLLEFGANFLHDVKISNKLPE